MAVSAIYERGNSRGGTNKSLARQYFVEGSSDEAEIIAAVESESPGILAGLVRSGVTIRELEDSSEIGKLWEATATYSEAPAQAEDSVEFEFDFQAPSARIMQSLSTISSTALSGTAPDFDGAINVINDGGKMRVEGFEISPPPVTFRLTFAPADGVVTPSYLTVVENLCGLVNSASYKGRAAGSLLLAQVNGGNSNNRKGRISFGFSYIQNRTSVPVGGITVASKDGMDLLWAYYGDAKDDTAKQLIKTPIAAYVERIWYRGDFAALGI